MSHRTLKFAASIRGILLEILPNTIKNWTIFGCTVTDVVVTDDLSIAKVYVAASNSNGFDFISELNRHTKTVTKKVSDRSNFRRAIVIRFLQDESNAHELECKRISKLLQEDE